MKSTTEIPDIILVDEFVSKDVLDKTGLLRINYNYSDYTISKQLTLSGSIPKLNFFLVFADI